MAKVYAPQISVKLVKAISRKDGIIPGVPVAKRYGDLAAIDLTPFLMDGGAVQTTKSVRDPSGGFSLTFADRIEPKLLDTLYALIEPMDLVEIRFCRDPSSYKKPEDRPPLIMRGIVTNVARNESMQGGAPRRAVTVSGQDFGKVLQIMQIYYLYENGVIANGDNLVSGFSFFGEYAGVDAAKIMSAKDFVGMALKEVINPALKTMTQFAHGEAVSAKVINEWAADVTVKGNVSPYMVSSLYNVSLHQFLSSLLDVGPFNELFTEDTPDGVTLIVRPAPFVGADGKLIQGVMPDVIAVNEQDILASSIARTDQGVANYFWVSNSSFAMFSNEDQRLAAAQGDPASFQKFDYLNCAKGIYGTRKMEVQSALMDPGQLNSEAPSKDALPGQTGLFADWLAERRRILAEINKDNVLFESGTLQVMGNERLKAGRYLEITRNTGVASRAYIVAVNHAFTPLNGFTTSLSLERGTGFIERAKATTAQYRLESY